jgi:hypothetical protein
MLLKSKGGDEPESKAGTKVRELKGEAFDKANVKKELKKEEESKHEFEIKSKMKASSSLGTPRSVAGCIGSPEIFSK